MYEVQVMPRAIKDIVGLPKEYTRLVSQHIDALADEPRPRDARKLRGRDDYRLRVGVYRVLYEIDDAKRVVTIFRVKHRREAYS
ncbi:MAG: type II toxin-antitoxin system RelE/ParE family toxin [Caldilineaceae bacterium]|nr:type II toxin-antitoxin system RelE/ParE family toxin [Caldilineaceae bacterium]